MTLKTTLSTILIITIAILNTIVELYTNTDINSALASSCDLNIDYFNTSLVLGFIIKKIKYFISCIY